MLAKLGGVVAQGNATNGAGNVVGQQGGENGSGAAAAASSSGKNTEAAAAAAAVEVSPAVETPIDTALVIAPVVPAYVGLSSNSQRLLAEAGFVGRRSGTMLQVLCMGIYNAPKATKARLKQLCTAVQEALRFGNLRKEITSPDQVLPGRTFLESELEEVQGDPNKPFDASINCLITWIIARHRKVQIRLYLVRDGKILISDFGHSANGDTLGPFFVPEDNPSCWLLDTLLQLDQQALRTSAVAKKKRRQKQKLPADESASGAKSAFSSQLVTSETPSGTRQMQRVVLEKPGKEASRKKESEKRKRSSGMQLKKMVDEFGIELAEFQGETFPLQTLDERSIFLEVIELDSIKILGFDYRPGQKGSSSPAWLFCRAARKDRPQEILFIWTKRLFISHLPCFASFDSSRQGAWISHE